MLQYGDHLIFKDFNWSVSRGDRWVLLGRNGTGKTTLFSMIFADHPMAYTQQIFLFGKRRGTGESIGDIKRRITYLGPEQMSYLNVGEWNSGREYLKNLPRITRTLNNVSAILTPTISLIGRSFLFSGEFSCVI